MPPGRAISTQLGQNFTTRVRNNRENFRFVVHARFDLAALHQGNGLQMRLMAWMPGDLPQDAELRKEIRIQQAMNLVRQLPTLFNNDGVAELDGFQPVEAQPVCGHPQNMTVWALPDPVWV